MASHRLHATSERADHMIPRRLRATGDCAKAIARKAGSVLTNQKRSRNRSGSDTHGGHWISRSPAVVLGDARQERICAQVARRVRSMRDHRCERTVVGPSGLVEEVADRRYWVISRPDPRARLAEREPTTRRDHCRVAIRNVGPGADPLEKAHRPRVSGTAAALAGDRSRPAREGHPRIASRVSGSPGKQREQRPDALDPRVLPVGAEHLPGAERRRNR